MNRRRRIALELLAPAPLGVLVLFLPWATWTAARSGRIFPLPPNLSFAIGFYLIYAYAVAALPSVLSAITIERAFARGLNPSAWETVRYAGWVGGIAGCAIGAVPFVLSGADFSLFRVLLAMGAAGLVVGWLLGLVIKFFSDGADALKANRVCWATAGLNLLALPALAWCMTRHEPAWLTMWAISFAEFFAVKIFTLTTVQGENKFWRIVAYLALWPGLNAREFLGDRSARPNWTRGTVLAAALLNTALGAVLLWWATRHIGNASPLLVGWVGMGGLIFLLHFGLFRAVAWAWCRARVEAPPIMRAPIAATSLTEFWSVRWNVAFAETARRFVFRPLARRLGTNAAGAAVFLLSGLIHESVISVPARGGWGGPTIYFLLQAAGIAVEKSAAGRRFGFGVGARGWLWTASVTVAPVPLLFHAAFVERVMVPFLREISLLLP